MFNKSEIMKRAWEIVKSNRNWKTLGAAFHLRRALWAAWAEAKHALLTSVQKRAADLRSGLIVAGSVWGGGGTRGFVRQWRATDNALESVAALSCDNLLCLDELSQVDGKAAGHSAYMLANGKGDGSLRPCKCTVQAAFSVG